MRAFKLAAAVASEGFSGGSVSYGPNQTAFDVGAALTVNGSVDPDAVIYTDAPSLIQALAQYPALESTAVLDGAVAVDAPGEVEDIPTSSVGVIPQKPPSFSSSQVEMMEPTDRITEADNVPAVHGDEDSADVVDEGADPDDDDLGIHD